MTFARLSTEALAGTDLAGEDQALGLLAGFAQAAGDQQGVGAFGFHRAGGSEADRDAIGNHLFLASRGKARQRSAP